MADASAPEPAAVAYQSLYRRFRPQRFADVRGQDHVTRALRNAVREDRVAHAYLFSGPRGTGKTSTARILAMALNCAHPEDGEPDGTCDSCRAVRAGSSLDVFELDAASNRKLDEMRDLLSRVSLGTSGRWKVYIVDEVHQLTTDASSALLKTLEEPPANVVFVLATTDPQKVLPTIRSRTQHFEFRLLGADVLGGLLRDVAERADLGLGAEAIDAVVRRGRGSARDALSALDQVAAAGEAEDEVGPVGALVEAIADRDPGAVLVATAEAARAGRDPRQLAVDLLEHLRNGFLATQARTLVLLPDDATAEVEAQARRLGLPGVVRALDVVGRALVDMRDSVEPRITLEAALVRLAAPTDDPGDLAARVAHLEQRLGAGGPGAVPPARVPERAAPPPPAPAPIAGRPAAPAAAPTPAGAPTATAAPTPAGAPVATAARLDAGAAPSAPVGPGAPAASPPGAPGPNGQSRARPSVDPPPLPGRPGAAPSGPRPARPTLGAHRRPPGAPDAPAPGTAAAGAAPPPRPDRSGPAEATPGPGASPVTGSEGLPTRDQLTVAWGDRVLPALQGALKAYVAAGRFVEVTGEVAIFALPDRGLLARAEPLRPRLEEALAAEFGRPVPLRLTVEAGAAPGGDPTRDRPEEDYSSEDLDDLQDAGPGLVSPEQRLLQAFPGAEEVSP